MDPTHFCSPGSLVSPALDPKEPLCSVAKQAGWVPQQAGKVGQPTSQPVFTLTGLEVWRAGLLRASWPTG